MLGFEVDGSCCLEGGGGGRGGEEGVVCLSPNEDYYVDAGVLIQHPGLET